MNKDLTVGKPESVLWRFCLPLFGSVIFQQLYNTVDTMIVGNVLGDTALAAIGSCGSIYELLVGFGIGIGNGLAIVAARSYGAQDHDLLKKTVAGSLVIGLVASLCITLAGVLGLHPLLLMLDTPAEILDDAYRYILTIDLGVLVMFAYNLCAGLLRAIGNSVMPLVFLLISSVLNVGLDLAFILVFRWGVAVCAGLLGGTAVADTIGNSFSSAKVHFWILAAGTLIFGAIGFFVAEMLIEKNFPHHGAVAFGNYGKALFEVFKYIGVPVEEIGYNQPKGVRYPTENPWG